MEYTFTTGDIQEFNSKWPCSNIPDDLQSISFDFENNGDLVDIIAIDSNGEYIDSAEFDGPALLAMSQDAQEFVASL